MASSSVPPCLLCSRMILWSPLASLGRDSMPGRRRLQARPGRGETGRRAREALAQYRRGWGWGTGNTRFATRASTHRGDRGDGIDSSPFGLWFFSEEVDMDQFALSARRGTSPLESGAHPMKKLSLDLDTLSVASFVVEPVVSAPLGVTLTEYSGC